MSNNTQELREEIATLSVKGHQLQNYLGSQHVDMLVDFISDRERLAVVDELTKLRDTYIVVKDMLYQQLEKKGFETSISVRAVELMIKNMNDRIEQLKKETL